VDRHLSEAAVPDGCVRWLCSWIMSVGCAAIWCRLVVQLYGVHYAVVWCPSVVQLYGVGRLRCIVIWCPQVALYSYMVSAGCAV
jgi:hypothetical protein